jgi:hypothetical protein
MELVLRYHSLPHLHELHAASERKNSYARSSLNSELYSFFKRSESEDHARPSVVLFHFGKW